MTTLDDCHIRTALNAAAFSPCRSRRGVALFDPRTGAHRGAGHNGPPASRPCPGRAICAGTCGQRSVHAEMRALREAEVYTRYYGIGPWDLVHVERAPDGGVVPCDGPSCWQCSREILDVGFVAGVWLYELVPEENCPHLVEHLRVDCPLCQGEACGMCHPGFGRPLCEHDVLDRHHGHRVVDAVWRRYSAEGFHRATLERCGMAP